MLESLELTIMTRLEHIVDALPTYVLNDQAHFRSFPRSSESLK